MDVDLAQLRALSAAVSEGTLDAAARALHVTPSAVSQRLRALETATGRVLLVRSRPVQVTASGEAVLRLARQVELLVGDTAAELGASAGADRRAVPVAVNADSMATWVLPALAPLADDLRFELHREDQARTALLLRDGTVVAAVTADADPVPGCSSVRLGAMRYRPMVAAHRHAEWFPDGATPQALERAPVVVFDRADELQHDLLRAHGVPGPGGPAHRVPASADFAEAVRLGLGWGMLPDLQSAELERRGEVVAIGAERPVDVVLHWQQWKLRSPALDRVAAAVRDAARAALT